jgi:hypothetical protein
MRHYRTTRPPCGFCGKRGQALEAQTALLDAPEREGWPNAGAYLARFKRPMSERVSVMSKYHFHCTDGRDFVLDREGVEIVAEGDLLWLASRAAARLISECLTSMAGQSG